MPLLMCPNDNGAMQTVERAGVQFDMCPTCRGVWLDRGELEKLMASAVSDAAPPPQAQPYAPPPQHRPQQPPQGQPWGFGGEHGERGEYGERGERGYGGHGKRRGSIFDIFD